MQGNKSTFKYYRQQTHPKMAKTPSLKLINPLTESRVTSNSKEDYQMMSQKRISQLIDTYSKQVVMSKSLGQTLRAFDKSSDILKEFDSFVQVDPSSKCDNLIQRLSDIIDLNSKAKKQIQKWQTRKQIETQFSSSGIIQLSIDQQSNDQKQKPATQKHHFNITSLSQQQQKHTEQTQNDQSEQYSQNEYNNYQPLRFRHMRGNSNLFRDKEGFSTTLKHVKHIWNLQDTTDSSQNNKSYMSMERLDEFVQDLNKKVVMTKIKVNELITIEKSSLIEDRVVLCGGQCQKQTIFQLRRQLHQIKVKALHYQQKVSSMENQLINKDKQIAQLNETIEKLNCAQKTSKQTFKMDKSMNSQKLQIKKKNLQIDVQEVSSSQQSMDFSACSMIKQPQSSQVMSFLSQTLPYTDAVFSTPCLSPTMLQMKSIERLQIQRRQKLRQLRKDGTGTKFLVNEIHSMAAGIPSPMSQQLIKEAINPVKNRFIRKPMSPMWGSLYISPQSSKGVQGETSIVVENEENANEQKSGIQKKKSIQISNGLDNCKAEEKMNLPYFMSLKKKHNPDQ